MAITQLPALDANPYDRWPVQDQDEYHRLPYWLVQNTIQRRREWLTWPKLFTKKSWKPNAGEIMTSLQIEPAPIRRTSFYPALIGSRANIDVVNFGEREVQARLHRHKWASPHYSFYPSFADFVADKFAPAADSLERIKMHAEEAFYRTIAFQKAPWVWICGYGAVPAPSSITEVTSDNVPKSDNWILAHLAKCGTNTLSETGGYKGPNGDGTLSFQELWAAQSFFRTVMGATPYSGSGLPSGMSSALNEKVCLLTDQRQWDQFVDDPWVRENRPLDMNIINGSLKGDFWGRVTSMLENYGWRWKAAVDDGAQSLTWLEPEEVETNADHVLYKRTGPGKAYNADATHMLSGLFGGKFAEIIDAGPPPMQFARKTGSYVTGPMQWNGQIWQTDQFTVPGIDAAGNEVTELASTWGEYRRLQAQTTYGMLIKDHFNYLPILHKMPDVGLTRVL